MTRRARLILTAASLIIVSPVARATVYDATWLGGTGNWDDALKWSLHTVPLNTDTDQYNASITGDSAVWAGNGTVNSVYLGTGARLDVGVGKLTATGGITVDGYVAMAANSVLRVGSGQAFNGTGTIDFFYGSCALTSTGGSLTIGPGLTVGSSTFPESASGTVGETAYPLINHGTIASLKQLATVIVAGQTFTNDGVLLLGANSRIDLDTTLQRLSDIGHVSNPTGSGTLRLIGTVDNADSTFVLDGSVPGLEVGGTIVGGTVTATPGYELRAADLLLDNVNLATPVVVGKLKVRDGQAFTGTADIRLAGVGTLITSETTAGTVVLGAGLNVHGAGTVGHTTGPLVNHAAVTADVPGQVLTIAGSAFTNDGTFRATNGGVLAFDGTYTLDNLGTVVNDSGTLRLAGTLDNTGRTFTNGSGRIWQLAGRIFGGAVSAPDGGGELVIPSTATATLDGVSVEGTIQLSPDSTLVLPTPLAGHATVLLGGPTSVITNVLFPRSTSHDLVLEAGVVIRGGSGTVGPTSSFAFYNHGLIQADPGAAITLRGPFGIFSDGTLSLLGGSTVTTSLSSLSLGNGGTLAVQIGGPAGQALLNVNGSLDLSGSDVLALDPLDPNPVGTYLIATYTGTLTGAFDSVTQGFVVDYSTPHKIYAVVVPEPAVAVVPALWAILARRRRRSARRR
jgi:fibronectin-binding autotransporter adhesin